MALKIGITRFLGTNCDQDIKKWMDIKGYQSDYLWYQDRFNINDYDAIIIPGGFSHGDYLRCGALAAKTQVMKSVSEFANKGKPVMGICNGFQILCEAKLLPGVLLQNKNLKFIDHYVELQFQNQDQFFTKKAENNQSIRLPIAHGEGQFFAPANELQKIQDNGQIWLTYKNNPNGSIMDIAGVMNTGKNVCGLMPHPERALFSWMGSTDGDLFLC